MQTATASPTTPRMLFWNDTKPTPVSSTMSSVLETGVSTCAPSCSAWALTPGSSSCVARPVMEPPLRLGRHCAALVFERDLDQQRGALAGGAGDLQRAAERFDSIAEPEQSGPLAGVGSPDPVVADRQPQDRVVGVELDLHHRRVR